MPNRARDKQLAKLAARRQAERQAAKRRRDITLGVVAGLVGLALLVAGYVILTSDDDGEKQASSTPSASASAEPSGKPGTRSGTVRPAVQPPETVACGATAPAGAGKPVPQFDGPPPLTIDETARYTATISTSCGTFEAELRPDIAPQAVNSFVFLAEQGFYDGLTFHRILDGFVIQGGDPEGVGSGGPGYRFDIETSPTQTFDAAGLLALANSSTPGSNGSQFFVTLAPQPNLDPAGGSLGYSIFGEVTKGLDVVQRIGKVSTSDNPQSGEPSVPTEAVYIESIRIEGPAA